MENGGREEQFQFEQSVKGELFDVPLEEDQKNNSHEAILPQRQRHSEAIQQSEEPEAEQKGDKTVGSFVIKEVEFVLDESSPVSVPFLKKAVPIFFFES